MGMKLEGADGLSKKFQKIVDSANTKMEAAVTVGAMKVMNSAKRKAPYKTGNLRSSIHIESESSGKDEAVVRVGTDVEYARRMEFGFRGTDSRGRKYNQGPHAYLRPALDENKAEVKREIKRALEKLL
ncbi:MAG: HK97-gp10 family putative phage morphogenesis protein [bacterium]